jgi:Uncharacterized protein conserved in bacteria (DUF2314)
MWWKRTLDLTGAAYFRGTLAPSIESLDGLARASIEVTLEPASTDQLWSATLRHRAWGQARIHAPRGAQPFPPLLVEFASGLTDIERELVMRDAHYPLILDVPARDGDVLRDRKRFLRFLAAVLGDDGVAGVDALSSLIWTRARLTDELAHEAPLDIVHIHALHLVSKPGGSWLHSHGLGELGFVDFDVLRPAEALLAEQFDVLRAIAFAIVEGGASSSVITPVANADPVMLIDASVFMRAAASADRALRDADEHSQRRVVCCEPTPPGLLRRLFGAKDAQPSRLLSAGMQDGEHLIRLSTAATELAAERARGSFGLLAAMSSEFAALECGPVVKLGYPSDSDPDVREHLWFEVHAQDDAQLDATLLNEPHDVARLRAGQRGEHSLEVLTDWALRTPLGLLTPHNLELARSLRELQPELLQAMKEAEPQA